MATGCHGTAPQLRSVESLAEPDRSFVGWNRQLDDNSSIGVLLGANGGMNTEYGTDIWRNFNNPAGTASSPTGVDFAQLFVGVPYALKLNERHAIGVMPIVAVQGF